jgi:hypothetical protein
MTAASMPALAADLDSGLRRLKLGTMRRLAPELMVTAKTQRWSPEEFLRTLLPQPAVALARAVSSGMPQVVQMQAGCQQSSR